MHGHFLAFGERLVGELDKLPDDLVGGVCPVVKVQVDVLDAVLDKVVAIVAGVNTRHALHSQLVVEANH